MRDLLKRPIAFHPTLARLFGGINEAILWQQIYYWSDKCHDPDGWVYKTKEELEEETTLTRSQQDTAKQNLIDAGWLKTEVRKVNQTTILHYQCQVGKVENQLSRKQETSFPIGKQETSVPSITESTREYIHSAEAEKESDDISLEALDANGEPLSERTRREPSIDKDVRAVFGMFATINPAFVLWRKIPAQREAAKVLVEKYGLEKTRAFLEASQRVKKELHAPQVDSPYDLLTKLSKLKNHEERGN